MTRSSVKVREHAQQLTQSSQRVHSRVGLMKPAIWSGVLSLTLLGFSSVAVALSIEDVPNPRPSGGWVTDLANLLSSSTEAELNQMISSLEAQRGDEIAVVTVPETAPAPTPKDFATEIFNAWKIGKQRQDNGVLILISQADRRVEIETGYGVEGILPDAKVGNIIRQEMLPRFKQDDYDGGTLAGTSRLVEALEQEAGPVATVPNLTQPISESAAQQPLSFVLYGFMSLGGVGVAAFAYSRRRASRRPVWIQPTGFSRIAALGNRLEMQRPAYCSGCKQPMAKLELSAFHNHLNHPQQVAQRLGSINFLGWHCPRCQPELNGPGSIHLRAFDQNDQQFQRCPTCQELTVVRIEKTLKQVTHYEEGKRLVIDTCHCCSYHREIEETVPLLPPSPRPMSTWSGTSGGGFYSSGGWSDGGSGGGFGGGSSGGGGAGGSW